MGKYSGFKDSLTRFSEEPEYKQRVNEKRKEIKDNLMQAEYPVNIRTLGVVYAKARQEKERLEALIKEQNLIIAAMNDDLVEILEANDFSKVNVTNNWSVGLKDDIYCTVKDKEAFYGWIRENKLEDLLTVNYQTMSAMVKSRLVDGEAIPPGIDTFFKQSITLYGGKNAAE